MNLRHHPGHQGWPESLNQQVAGLPQRWLLRNERVGVVLAGLKPGQQWVLGPLPEECLLAVTFGQARLLLGSDERVLEEGESTILAPGVAHHLHAGGQALDFLLMNLHVRGAAEAPVPRGELTNRNPFRQPAAFRFDYAHFLS